jgi:hypothetical protein
VHPHRLGLNPNRLSDLLNQKLVGVEGAEPIKTVLA